MSKFEAIFRSRNASSRDKQLGMAKVLQCARKRRHSKLQEMLCGRVAIHKHCECQRAIVHKTPATPL